MILLLFKCTINRIRCWKLFLVKIYLFFLLIFVLLFCKFSTRPIRFNIALPSTYENKENTRPYNVRDDNDSDQSDGPILYRDDDNDRASKVARKESLSIKLALRPDRQDLINRNILQLQNDNDHDHDCSRESKEAIGARLIRRLSMRPTAGELIERNILKSKFFRIRFL